MGKICPVLANLGRSVPRGFGHIWYRLDFGIAIVRRESGRFGSDYVNRLLSQVTKVRSGTVAFATQES